MKLNLLHTVVHYDFYGRVYKNKLLKFFLIYHAMLGVFYMIDSDPNNPYNICKLKKL